MRLRPAGALHRPDEGPRARTSKRCPRPGSDLENRRRRKSGQPPRPARFLSKYTLPTIRLPRPDARNRWWRCRRRPRRRAPANDRPRCRHPPARPRRLRGGAVAVGRCRSLRAAKRRRTPHRINRPDRGSRRARPPRSAPAAGAPALGRPHRPPLRGATRTTPARPLQGIGSRSPRPRSGRPAPPVDRRRREPETRPPSGSGRANQSSDIHKPKSVRVRGRATLPALPRARRPALSPARTRQKAAARRSSSHQRREAPPVGPPTRSRPRRPGARRGLRREPQGDSAGRIRRRQSGPTRRASRRETPRGRRGAAPCRSTFSADLPA